ncbi:transcription factor HES-5-like [Syngnathus acus]|uniref:transcription factor HES-5-like n=1 Tax=Syngnathus acus TaxID=161584 RepID=UPI0018861FA7|nr:transcription factor HES-5-like [Syngnathus acus]
MKSRENTLCMDSTQMHPAMAPAISLQDSLTPTHKIRKPLVEKFRRERINSSIEQLKSLLSAEFLRQHNDSKMEKADILEMTVCVLRRLQSVTPAGARFGRLGFSLEEKSVAEEDLSPLSSPGRGSSSSSSKEERSSQSVPWRPW